MDKNETACIKYDTVWLDEETEALAIIDQTKLPGRTEILYLSSAEDIFDAIFTLKVRGAAFLNGVFTLKNDVTDADILAWAEFPAPYGAVTGKVF